mmetsp:Transcript_30990/g.51365  ORF Transcript_30990/g.51365 Transcript_30990/m.51365 type:complete len:259 (-) Transcript_30990:113-889(-)|eukprot:CAMPEP_0119321634 /NCGR_PEP_ID=MMETSP1333-20130426/55942_1 /TAXON_ID=418940 /ORGANISM="Scyphosphaera apsteinii, Strain RCC1455" /LENGTH=258 /DNA_ID=CAMNT_0007328645 /DNA_START=32 /DNA_END=808 /DNA_ORIENTATION=+
MLLVAATFVAASESDSLLKFLPAEYVSAPWSRFENEASKVGKFSAFYKKAVTVDGESGPAVVKVVGKCRVPMSEVVSLFLSKDQRDVAEWNPIVGEVKHLDKTVNLQTYQLPWPFQSREYLVRCEANTRGKLHATYCASIDAHPEAPLRADRVRGHSETVWRFTAEGNDQTSIHLETLVDPRGKVPVWVVDKLGKMASVSVVRALMKSATKRLEQAKANAKAKVQAIRAGVQKPHIGASIDDSWVSSLFPSVGSMLGW